MRRRAIIFCLLAMLCIGGAAAWKYKARLFPSSEVSPLYLLYQDETSIEADYVDGMLIADSLRIDITRLHVTDSAAWQRLEEDFALPNITDIEEDFLDKRRDVTRRTAPCPRRLWPCRP